MVHTTSCSYANDVQAACDLTKFLATMSMLDFKISGLIFFHSMNKSHMSANDIREVNFLKALVGKSSLNRVAFVTTNWDTITQGTGIKRETELLSFVDLYGRSTIVGKQTLRYLNSRESAINIIEAVLSQGKHHVLAIQDEIVKRRMPLKGTAIGHQLFENLTADSTRLTDEIGKKQNAINVSSKHLNYKFGDLGRISHWRFENELECQMIKAQRAILESYQVVFLPAVRERHNKKLQVIGEGTGEVSFMDPMEKFITLALFTSTEVDSLLGPDITAHLNGRSSKEFTKPKHNFDSNLAQESKDKLLSERMGAISQGKYNIQTSQQMRPSSPTDTTVDPMEKSVKKSTMEGIMGIKDVSSAEAKSQIPKPIAHSESHGKPRTIGSFPRIFPIDATKDAALISVWKDSLLPNIGSIVPNNGDKSVSVSLLRRGKSSDESDPILRVQTSQPRSKEQQEEIDKSINKLLASFAPVHVVFVTGSVKRTAIRSDLEARPCPPHNTGFSPRPPMGVSIGVGGSTKDTATLGGYIYIDDVPYMLTVHHLFVDDDTQEVFAPGTAVTQPSLQEVKEFSELWERIRARGEPFHPACVKEVFENMKSSLPAFSFASFAHSSGYRNRRSRDGDSNVEMDWAICKVERNRAGHNVTPCNMHRVRDIAKVIPGANVFAVGRTSGKQAGAVNGCTTYLSFTDEAGISRESQEWIILRPDAMAEQAWISSGIGVSGDSGAWVLESGTANVIGLLWGRNHQAGQDGSDGEVFTYFTPIVDIFDDIRDHIHLRSITISTNQHYDLVNDTRSQQISPSGMTNFHNPELSSANICRICNGRVSSREAQESILLLGDEIAGLNMARQQNQTVLKLRAMSLPGIS
jgi:hypothetical protein